MPTLPDAPVTKTDASAPLGPSTPASIHHHGPRISRSLLSDRPR
jgi:hypothetical protein